MSGNLAVSTINGVDISVSPVLNETQLKGALNATGTAPIYACRAWENFNGTGTVAIRASGNVSSITDNGVGDYTVNFTTAMPDANYGVSGFVAKDIDSVGGWGINTSPSRLPTVSNVRFFIGSVTQNYDTQYCSIIIHR